MTPVGRNPAKRLKVRIASNITVATGPSVPEVASIIDIANYIAQLCSEMARMAQVANLPLLAHFLAMAQAEAECAEQVMK